MAVFRWMPERSSNCSGAVERNQPVIIRAVGVPLKTYYRLDALLQPETLSWPVNAVLLPQAIASSKISVFGWIGANSVKTYIPVERRRVTARGGRRPDPALLRASAAISHVRWRTGDIVNGVSAA